MRIIVMGSSAFTLPALKKLINFHDVVAVYTRQSKPAGRGMKLRPTLIENYAQKHNIPVFTPKNFKTSEDIETFKNLNADMAVVAAYGIILPRIILDAPKYGCINIHGSLLPRWRGAAPIHRAIMAGDHETGVAIMQMSEGLDEGDVFKMASVPINLEDTTGKLHDKLADMGADLLFNVIKDIANKTAKPIPQDNNLANYADKITKAECLLEFENHDAIQILRKINALNPFPSAYMMHHDYRIKIHAAELIEQNGPVGSITDDFTIYCQSQAIRPLIVQKEGKQKQNIKDFLNGAKSNLASPK